MIRFARLAPDPGEVCRRKLRAPFGYQRNTHRIEQVLSGAYNSAKNRELVDQVFLIASERTERAAHATGL